MKMLAALVLTLFISASAAQAPLLTVSPATVELFTQMAADASRYKIPKDRPRVVIMPGEWFIKHPSCGGDASCTVGGLFSWTEPTTIYLRVDMPPSMREAILVHEIVHWLQYSNGQPAGETCAEQAVIEAEAYTAAYKFMVTKMGYPGGFWHADLTCK